VFVRAPVWHCQVVSWSTLSSLQEERNLAEMGLSFLAYNMIRAINIVAINRLQAAM